MKKENYKKLEGHGWQRYSWQIYNWKRFLVIYNLYSRDPDPRLMPELSSCLKKIEKGDDGHSDPLSEMGKVIGYQILRGQEFDFGDKEKNFKLESGDIFIVYKKTKKILINRISFRRIFTDKIFKIGYCLNPSDQRKFNRDPNDLDWVKTVEAFGLSNEEGLYLPLHSFSFVFKLLKKQLVNKKRRIVHYMILCLYKFFKKHLFKKIKTQHYF